ncbi:MAG: hypothetical protein J5I93_01775 [Pirellulaceae bacterium]|nr:hypothetical protein [Pirellulaceae bacterium]
MNSYRHTSLLWCRAVASGSLFTRLAVMLPLAVLAVLAVLIAPATRALAAEPIELGSRRELFVDRLLVDRLEGDAELKLHQPEPREVVLVTDKPWEGNTCAYYTIFQDGDRYRMYYRGSHYDEATKKASHREVTCYAESKDGIHWTKPALGLHEFNGSKENNIVLDGVGTHCFACFKDENPACAPEARYKGLGRGPGGLFAFQSPDGIRWTLMAEKPVITKGAFDSQNLAFWDPHLGKYREFHRAFRGVRDIMTGTSDDFLSWTEPKFLEYPGAPQEHLYTNAIRNYFRAPHILLGFPTRFQAASQQVEPVLMASRDGATFHRWPDPVIPITAPEDRDGNRSNYMTWGLLQLPGSDRELSVYATEAYYTGPDSRLRRFTYRTDGFVSLHASQGELVTPPLTFDGQRLELNLRTARSGSVRVELQDADGKPIAGFGLDDCTPLAGDSIAQDVSWKSAGKLGDLAGKPVRLRLQLRDADVYSLRFQ